MRESRIRGRDDNRPVASGGGIAGKRAKPTWIRLYFQTSACFRNPVAQTFYIRRWHINRLSGGTYCVAILRDFVYCVYEVCRTLRSGANRTRWRKSN
jgi:hypothetical protein